MKTKIVRSPAIIRPARMAAAVTGVFLICSAFAMDLVQWNADVLEFKASCTSINGEELTDHTATLCRDSVTDKTRLLRETMDGVRKAP